MGAIVVYKKGQIDPDSRRLATRDFGASLLQELKQKSGANLPAPDLAGALASVLDGYVGSAGNQSQYEVHYSSSAGDHKIVKIDWKPGQPIIRCLMEDQRGNSQGSLQLHVARDHEVGTGPARIVNMNVTFPDDQDTQGFAYLGAVTEDVVALSGFTPPAPHPDNITNYLSVFKFLSRCK